MLLLLAALWGGSFLFIKIGAPALGPLVLIELRVLLAGITLIILARATRHKIRISHRWWQYLILGVTNAAIPFTLISIAELRLDAGLAAILNATTPMFTALTTWFWSKERLNQKKLYGIILGFVGVGVLVGWDGNTHGRQFWLYPSLSLIAALFYAVAGVFSSRHFRGEKPLDMAIGQQFGATLLLLPFSLATLPHEIPSPVVMSSVLGLAVLCTAVAYLFYFALIHSVGPLKTLTVTFLVPVFGVIWGGLFLGESITARLVVGLLIILSSVALVANVTFKRKRMRSTSPAERK